MAKIDHLKQYWFQKGQTGNPGGRPKNLFTRKDVDVLFQKFVTKTKAELAVILDDPDSSVIELLVCNIMIKAVTEGDASRAHFLIENAVGKLKEQVETVNLNINQAPPTYVVEMTDGGKFATPRPKLLVKDGDE